MVRIRTTQKQNASLSLCNPLMPTRLYLTFQNPSLITLKASQAANHIIETMKIRPARVLDIHLAPPAVRVLKQLAIPHRPDAAHRVVDLAHDIVALAGDERLFLAVALQHWLSAHFDGDLLADTLFGGKCAFWTGRGRRGAGGDGQDGCEEDDIELHDVCVLFEKDSKECGVLLKGTVGSQRGI